MKAKNIFFCFLIFLSISASITKAQWAQLNGPYGASIKTLAISGNNIFAVTNVGVFLSTDNGINWNAVNNGLTATLFSCIAINNNNIFVGTSDRGIFLSTNDGSSWTAVNDGLTETNVNALAISNNNIFAGTGNRGVFLSTDNGLTWKAANIGLPTNNYIFSILVNGNNIFASFGGGKGVFLSTNNGSSWKSVSIGLPSNGAVNVLAIRGNNIFAGTSDQGVFLSTDNGSTWLPVNNGLSSIANIRAFAINGNHIFAATWTDGVFLSTDDGLNWTPVNNGLTNVNTVSLATINNYILVGTYTNGIWKRLLSEMSIFYSVVTVSNPSNGGTTNGAGIYTPGQSISITATPTNDYYFVNWTEGGTIVSTNASYQFNISNNRTLVANFSAIQYNVTTASSPNNGGTTTGGGSYNSGSQVTVVATANSGYNFVNWIEGIGEVSKNQNYQFIIKGNRNLVANFVQIPILSVTPDFVTLNSQANVAVFIVTNSTSGGTMNWTAVSNASWITITSGKSGTNSDVINLVINANTGNARVGTITITAPSAIGSPKVVEVRQSMTTNIEELGIGKPISFNLSQNYPNPFNPSTTIKFSIPNSQFVTLTVYDMLGRETTTLVNEEKIPGDYEVKFNGSKLSSGVYFYRIQTGTYSDTKKFILMK
ncbi:MAG: T9SS type A sorting domain-containing protein [Melioribacteraceae bacterium]